MEEAALAQNIFGQLKILKKGLIFPPKHELPKKVLGKKPIEDASLAAEVVIPLSQHIGAPCNPLVKAEERVLVGQKIGNSDSYVSASVHSSVSGEVVVVEPRLNHTGNKVLSVVIAPDGKQETLSFQGLSDEEITNPDKVRTAIREAGLAGLGGAAFPTHVKLTPPKDKPISDVIINGCECEPYIAGDHRNMLENAEAIIDGLKIILKTLGAKKGYIAIETNKIDAIHHISDLVSSEENIKVVPLIAKYPQGAEKQLIQVLLHKEVPSGCIPSEVGALVQNVGTVIAISEAVRKGKPLTERILSVAGPGINEPKNLRVKIGTPVSHLIEECGGFKGDPGKIVFGGPMTGFALFDLDVPVIKGTSGIVVLPKEMVHLSDSRACIRCGSCIQICPVSIMPNYIGQYAEVEMIDQAEEADVMDCIECGLCSYVCPAHRPLIQLIRHAKAKIVSNRKKGGN
ncbi:electron transport complex subunit RsxC [Candidatus Oleimmundimicrobium sp.]|uniref:electron transport complex subunit RsxC n=1 Tax=Candidatus Oleimmundimicrobium sp. TaxID=3060597 RepID=UPI0027230522|nr:electron transport complex subunit RsxC [Candidatus Oleimmundimicrobium sp.]MDO8886129.1 electron transport complex subunit RsxC [Candidatus Oleimmundimicrobium sp.]